MGEELDSRLRIDRGRWERAVALVESWCARGLLPSAGLIAGRGQAVTDEHLFGKQRLSAEEGSGDEGGAIRKDAIFLVASITKPVIATAILMLVERGQVVLGDRVEEYIPEFRGKKKRIITVRHLLTHTSGLPDMLPNNRELREAQAPFSKFIAEICELTPGFPAGRGLAYQSMGIALLGELIRRVTGKKHQDFVREEILRPLGMNNSELGAPDAWYEGNEKTIERVVELQVPEDQKEATSWNWNSRYWQQFGAPWGGLLTTPRDLSRLARMMLGGGEFEGVRLLSPASIAEATRSQVEGFPDLPEYDRRCRPWGYGWKMAWPGRSENFGDLVSPATYGHWGSTGSVLWIDPRSETFLVFLTSLPQDPHGEYLSRCSNAVAAAFQ